MSSRTRLSVAQTKNKATFASSRSGAGVAPAPVIKPTRVIRRAVGLWKASEYDGSQYLKDLNRNGLDARLGSGIGVDTSDPTFLDYKPQGLNRDGSLNHLGSIANFLESPDQIGQVPTGDFDLRWRGRLTSNTVTQSIISKYGTTTTDICYLFQIMNTKVLRLFLNVGTGVVLNVDSSAGVPDSVVNAIMWYRVTWRQSDGRVQFFTSTDGATWTQIGTDRSLPTTAGRAPVRASGTPIRIGAHGARGSTGASGLTGATYEAMLLDGAGNPLWRFNAAKVPFRPFYNDGLGNLWYGYGSAQWGDHFQNSALVNNQAASQPMANFDAGGDFQILTTAKNTTEHKMGQYVNGILFRELSGGVLNFYSSFVTNLSSSVGILAEAGVFTGAPIWMRVWWRRDRGDGQYEVKFYWSYDGHDWRQLGVTRNGATTGVATTSLQPVTLGGYADGSTPYATKVFRAIAYDINGVKKLDVDFTKPLKWTGAVASPTVTDNFNRADGAIGTSPTGHVWTARAGTWNVASNLAAIGAAFAAGIVTVSPGLANCVISCKFPVAANAGLVFRYVDINNYWVVGNAGQSLSKVVRGVSTLVAGNFAAGANNDTIELLLLGDTIVMKRNGVLLASVSDGTHATATIHGLYNLAGNTARWDDFSVSLYGHHVDPQGNIWRIARSVLTPRLKIVANSHIETPGISGNYTDTPDVNELDIAGDIDIRWYGSMDQWLSSGRTQTLVAKYVSGSGSWILRVFTSGLVNLLLVNEADSVGSSIESSIATGIADGTASWIRATWRQSDNRVQFFRSSVANPTSVDWIQIGTDRTMNPVVAAIKNSTHPLSIGARGSGGITDVLAGKTYEVQVWRGIPGVSSSARLVANPKFTALTNYAPYREAGYLGAPGVDTAFAGVAAVPAPAWPNVVDLRADVTFDDWAGTGYPLSRIDATILHLSLQTNTDKTISARWRDTQGNKVETSSEPLPAIIGDRIQVRCTINPASTAATSEVMFYYRIGTSDLSVDTGWTQLGSSRLSATTATAWYAPVPDQKVGSSFKGKVHRALTKHAGTTVFDTDFTNLLDGQASFVDPTGKTVTISGTARIERRVWTFFRAAQSARAELRTGQYAYLPGVNGNFITAGAASNIEIAVTGDVDVRAKVTPATLTGAQSVVSALDGTGQDAYALELSNKRIGMRYSIAGSGRIINISTVDLPFDINQTFWIRATRTAATDTHNFYWSLDGTTWVQLGAAVVGSLPGELRTYAGLGLRVGQYGGGGFIYFNGSVHAIEVRDGIGGTIVAGFDLADAILMPTEPHNTYTDLYQNVWTVSRASTGLKSVVVDRPLFLFGTDDYMEVLYNALLSFGLNDPLTLVMVYRIHHNISAALIGSYSGTLADRGVGMQLTTTPALQPIWTDGLVTGNAGGTGGPDLGVRSFAVAQRDISQDRWYAWRPGKELRGAGAVDTATQGLESTQPFRIGRRSGGGANYLDGEFIGAAVFREVLTDAEITELIAEFDYDPELVGIY